MYVRRCYRTKNGKRHAYWALVESYRTARGPRQRVVAYLGELDEGGRIGVQQAVQPTSTAQAHLFRQADRTPRMSTSTHSALSNAPVCSEDFTTPALKNKNLPPQLRKLG